MSGMCEDGVGRQAGPETTDDDVRRDRLDPSAPSDRIPNQAPQAQEHRQERKKKTRRRKPKRKNPYNKQMTENRVHHNNKPNNNNTKRIYAALKQPVAPYNSNQFLIEDHNDLRDFDVELLAAANKPTEARPPLDPARPPRLRDSSFTSADSDEDFFYSSPEDEEEFLTKEFSNTYQDLHVESLTQMSKSELVQHVLQLEEKVDLLEKRLEAYGSVKTAHRDTTDNPPQPEIVPGGGVVDKIIKFQQEISTLVLANEELQNENEKLKRQKKRSSSASSVDSESDSSTSSGSSGMSPPAHHVAVALPNGTTSVDNDCSMDTDNAR